MKKVAFWQKVYYLPFYISQQIFVRSGTETANTWNKWQPTRNQSLSQFIAYELEFSPDPTNAITSRMWALIILIPALIFLISIG